MLNSIVKWSIAQRWLVVIASILISLLTLLVLPALYVQFSRFLIPKNTERIIQTEIAGEASF
jgi:Cu/Ag efflux pump CusA